MSRKKDQAAVLRVHRAKLDEHRVAAQLGGRRLPASGALISEFDGKSARADIDIKDYWVEQKSTDAGKLTLQVSWLQKVWEGSRILARKPALTMTLRAVKRDFALITSEAAETLKVDVPAPLIVKAGSMIVSADTLAPGQTRAFRFEALLRAAFSLELEQPPVAPTLWVLLDLTDFAVKREALWNEQ